MSLSVGLGIAQSSLSVSADQTSVLSRNVANAGNANSSRKTANVVTAPGGGVRIASITRVTNDALFRSVLSTTSSASGQKALVDALDRLDQTVNDPELDASPAALYGKFTAALQQYADSPSNTVLARTAVSAASDLAHGLNIATQTVQEVRQQADDDMADSVSRINDLLQQFSTLNAAVVKGTRNGTDVTDQLDARDQVLRSIAEEIGIRTVPRSDGGVAIYTDSGATLFDLTPRTVSFDRTSSLPIGASGNPVYVDGVPVVGPSTTMAASSGKLVALASVRDDTAVTYQSQLDEIARGLIDAFKETDQSGSALPDMPGLFTWPGAPAFPPSGSIQTGLAATISINASVDPAQGGDPSLLRDGAISGNPAYAYNTTGAAGFSDRLQALVDQANATASFDPAAQAGTSVTISQFAASSAAWLEAARKSAGSESEYRSTLLDRSNEALSKISGVNLDEEMTNMLELERSYQASSRVISSINDMFETLLQAVG